MTLSTYVAGALLLTILVGIFSSHPASLIVMVCAALGALLPHWLEHPKLQYRFGYRMITHSLLGLVLISLLVSPICFTRYAALATALLLGYASHLLLDATTTKGVLLFYPALARAVLPRHPLTRIEPGTDRERLLRRWLIGLWLVLLPLNAIGLRGVLRWLIPAPQFAVEDYLRYSGESRRVFVEFTGRFTVSQRSVSGQWEALDAPSSTSLLVEDPQGGRYTLGTHPQDSILALTVRAHKGPPVAVTLRTVQLHDQPLGDLLSLVPAEGQTYLLGRARVSEAVPTHWPVDQLPAIRADAHHVELRFATVADLRAQGVTDLVVSDGDLLLRTLAPAHACLPREIAAGRQDHPVQSPLISSDASPSHVLTLTIAHLHDPQEILVRPHARIQPGQLLVDMHHYRAELVAKQHAVSVQLIAAHAALDALRRTHDHTLALQQQEDRLAGTHRDFVANDTRALTAAEARVTTAQARLDAITHDLTTTELRAPVSGRVLSIQTHGTTATILMRHD